MTTTNHRRDILARIADTRHVIDQAAAEGRVVRGEAPTWRDNALERAGDFAVAGMFQESRRFSRMFIEGD